MNELSVIGDRDRMAEFAKAADKHRRDGSVVARTGPHQGRAAEAENFGGSRIGVVFSGGRAQPALIDRHITAAKRSLPPPDIRFPVHPRMPPVLVEITDR